MRPTWGLADLWLVYKHFLHLLAGIPNGEVNAANCKNEYDGNNWYVILSYPITWILSTD